LHAIIASFRDYCAASADYSCRIARQRYAQGRRRETTNEGASGGGGDVGDDVLRRTSSPEGRPFLRKRADRRDEDQVSLSFEFRSSSFVHPSFSPLLLLLPPLPYVTPSLLPLFSPSPAFLSICALRRAIRLFFFLPLFGGTAFPSRDFSRGSRSLVRSSFFPSASSRENRARQRSPFSFGARDGVPFLPRRAPR